MHINELIRPPVGADLSRTPPIMNINKLSATRFAIKYGT